MSVQIKNIDIPDIGAISLNQLIFIGSAKFKNLFFQVVGEDLDANDSQWELHQSNNRNFNFELVPGSEFTLSDLLQSFDLSNVSATYIALKLVNKGTVTEGILKFEGTLKGN